MLASGALNIVPGGVATTTLSRDTHERFHRHDQFFHVRDCRAGVTAVYQPRQHNEFKLVDFGGRQRRGSGDQSDYDHRHVRDSDSFPSAQPHRRRADSRRHAGQSVFPLQSFRYLERMDGLSAVDWTAEVTLILPICWGRRPVGTASTFNLGPANADDAVSCSGQTITLPVGNFTSLQILGTAVDGSQSAQHFTVTYTDNSTATLTQSFSDWAYPQDYAGESLVVGMAYRNNGGGSKDLYTAVERL